jgi:hypothetical protein
MLPPVSIFGDAVDAKLPKAEVAEVASILSLRAEMAVTLYIVALKGHATSATSDDARACPAGPIDIREKIPR